MSARRAAVLWGGWLTVAAVTGLGIGGGWVAWERPLPGPPSIRTADDGTGQDSDEVQQAPCSHEDPAAARCATSHTTASAAAEDGTPDQTARPTPPSTSAVRHTPRPSPPPRESRQPETGGHTSTPPQPTEREQEVGDGGGRTGAPAPPSATPTPTPTEPSTSEPSPEPTEGGEAR